MNNELEKRLKQLKTEDYIWILYIGIIILSLYSNTLERKYFLYNDNISKEKYRKITIGLFTVLVIVYAYFLNDSYSDYKNIKKEKSPKKKELITLSFIGSLLIFISGILFLYIALSDENIDVEVAFN
ncbi:MAG: hypothetical protein IJ094_01685 [Bacilli bacterium]|nr:hypothetical protein [Bacilli bacterium]